MKKVKILIVEDEALIALQLKMKLSQIGYDVCEPTGRGEDAIAMTHRENPDVILMDIRLLGEMDGIETARRIIGFSRAKIIFMTGLSDPEMKALAMALNPAAYLDKPVEIRKIQSVIQDSR